MEEVGAVAAERRRQHLLDEVVGEAGDGGAESGHGVRLELGLAPEQLRHVDVGQPGLRRYLAVALPGAPLRRRQPLRNYSFSLSLIPSFIQLFLFLSTPKILPFF